MKTYFAKADEVKENRKWYLIDATDLVLGRVSAEIAKILRGKHKPTYSPNLDCGDNIVVINAKKIHLTGTKNESKVFNWHTGWPGGIKEEYTSDTLKKYPERVIERAVKRMMPRGPLGRECFSKLRVYAGNEHPHEAQKPEVLDFAGKNVKNAKREGSK